MSSVIVGPTATLKATAALGAHLLVKAGADGFFAVAALNEEPIGVLQEEAFAANDVRAVHLVNSQGTVKCVAAGAFAFGAVLYGRAGGQVDDIATGALRIGIAVQAATAANDVVEVMLQK